MTIGAAGPMMMRGPGPDLSVTRQQIKAGTAKRVLPYARPYRGRVALLLASVILNTSLTVATPLLFKYIIDNGIAKDDTALVLGTSLVVAGLAVFQMLLGIAESWFSAQVAEGLVYHLRTRVFDHVQRQSLAFFTRAQTGALVSRLNTDVVAAQQAVAMLLSSVVSAALTLVFVLATMFVLAWQIALLSVLVLPLFVLPGRIIGRRLQRLTRAAMQTNAELGSMMNERFNVTGALLAKLYGRPATESRLFAGFAAKARELGVRAVVHSRMLFLSTMFLSAIATAVVYGVGGSLVIGGAFGIGTLVALATLLVRLFNPISMLSNAQASVLTALVSFDRLFEILDLRPLVDEKPDAVAIPGLDAADGTAPEITFEDVSFRYPRASEVSLASLELIAAPVPDRRTNELTLHDVSFVAPAGKLTALVGPSGAGKTTLTHLVPRLYDPTEGTVRISGHDLRDLTLDSLRDTVGIVTQDSYLFHATIRENLAYARPDADDRQVMAACKAAQIWNLIEALPDGLDTVVGDRGYRLSGGEKQRIAMARLLLKAPAIVVLDEATAHLDSESEAALQRALKAALAGRTSLVIAHRLSTIRDADQILVVDKGRIVERGTHDELLNQGGVYAELYRTQFSGKSSRNGDGPQADGDGPRPEPASARGPMLGGPGPFPGGPGPFPGGPPPGHP